MGTIDDLLPEIDGDTLRVELNLALYPLSVIFKACYLFTDRTYVYLCSSPPNQVHVYLKAKLKDHDLRALAGDFLNELVNQRLRFDITSETGKIRELLVAQAFAEGFVTDPSSVTRPGVAAASESMAAEDHKNDPHHIGL